MAEETPNSNSLTVPPSVPFLGGMKVTGPVTILAIMMAGAMWWVYDQNKLRTQQFVQIHQQFEEQNELRNKQFERLGCKIEVGVFVHSFPKGQIDWSLLPADLYTCIPNFKLK